MDVVVTFAILVVGVVVALAGLGLAALRWGVDTRPGLLDDHIR
jgi:nitrogen fixation-related uncharacterized protein